MSREDMISEIEHLPEEASDRGVEEIYWTVKGNLS